MPFFCGHQRRTWPHCPHTAARPPVIRGPRVNQAEEGRQLHAGGWGEGLVTAWLCVPRTSASTIYPLSIPPFLPACLPRVRTLWINYILSAALEQARCAGSPYLYSTPATCRCMTWLLTCMRCPGPPFCRHPVRVCGRDCSVNFSWTCDTMQRTKRMKIRPSQMRMPLSAPRLPVRRRSCARRSRSEDALGGRREAGGGCHGSAAHLRHS